MTPNLISESTWILALNPSTKEGFEFLALKILLGTLRMRLQTKSATPSQCAVELKTFFTKHAAIPAVQRDLEKISHLKAA
ncbi:MAG: hypothetical protein QM796_01185 [Chthoniobacteraceae bacterium]